MKIELGTLITIITMSVALGSTYYAVQHDIDHLQKKVSALEKKVRKCACVRKKKSL